MKNPSKVQKIALGALIGDVLHSSVTGVEPSPQVWNRIETTLGRLIAAENGQPSIEKSELDLRPRFLNHQASHG